MAREVQSASANDSVHPCRESIQRLFHHLAIIPPRTLQHMKGMIGAFKQMQRRARSEALDDRLEQTQFRERIARALQEQHLDFDISEMFGPIAGRLSGRMQRKTEKRQ